jgi:HK97 family phage portal protein
MRSPVAEIARIIRPVDKAPVPYTPRRVPGLPWYTQRSTEGQLRAMGQVGTLFAIVDRLASSTAAVEWNLYRAGKPGQREEDREEVTSHLALDIWDRPNSFYTRALFVETVQQHFELVGEEWWVVARNPSMRSIPLELWPVRPDRMQPVPSPDDYVVGYVYTSPDGEQIPLRLDEVIFIRRPNPWDSYRGIGAVQTILADLEGVRLSAEWNRNFFLNSAEPGGILQYEGRLSDERFDEVVSRWQEQHKGVANAHRVAIIEGGQWVDRKYTNRDMQFAELRGVSSQVIREAFGIPKFAVGDIDDVNRATAEASRVWFAEQMTVPRLERLKQALNAQFLPLFGVTGKGVEFDYSSPVPGDREADDRERDSKTSSYKTLVDAGVDPEDAADAVGLPRMRHLAAAPAPAAMEEASAPADLVVEWLRGRAPRALPERIGIGAQDNPPLPSLAPVRQSYETAFDQLMNDWGPILANQINSLAGQVQDIVDSGDLTELMTMTAPTDRARRTLTEAMTALGSAAAVQVVAEAHEQGVTAEPAPPDEDSMSSAAAIAVGLLAAGLVSAAAGEAVRIAAPGASGRDVASQVRTHLEGLSDTSQRDRLGGALHSAQHAGRMGTLKAAPDAAYYGSEEMDGNTCDLCAEVDGRWLGNTVSEAEAEYPNGGYINCLGRDRCRGTVVAVWRPEQVRED